MTATTFPSFDTHQVSNQPSVLEGFNAFDTDPMLQAAVRHYGADWAARAQRLRCGGRFRTAGTGPHCQ